jgi:WD40-like Beta Propeller Repeat
MHTPTSSVRRALSALLIAGASLLAVQAGCGDSGDTSVFPGPTGEDGGDLIVTPPFPDAPDGGQSASDADPDALGTLVITPPTATITISVVDGVVTANAPATFSASYNGATVTPQWLFDRGELGDVAANGVFTANGKNVGQGTITARFGAREGTAKVTVVMNQTQNGAPAGADAGAGPGGLGGVGGEPLGAAVAPATVTKLKTESNAPASAAELGFLYPYDKTVWPRGLLAPLVMWQTTRTGDAVYVKLSQGNYTFEGTYALTQFNVNNVARKRTRLQDEAWRIATSGNQGDDLQLDVKIYSAADNKVYGPITEKWKVAPGVLKGTVYYNSYDSFLTGGASAQTGGVIAIKPRSPDPVLAVPTQAGKCHVCHTVSADGSTLWAQDSVNSGGNDNYARGAAYDLQTPANPRTVYDGINVAAHNRKFVWAAPYPDGSFALVSSRYAREAYTQGDSKLFSKADGSELASTGFSTAVQSAVTPAFSPDGRKVAFNFWTGPGAGGVTAGAGRSIAAMDFNCGAAAGSTKCAAGTTPAFTGMRELYKDANRWPGWPSFTPDGKALVFHNASHGGECAPSPPNNTKDANGEFIPYAPSTSNCQLTTWYFAKSELWWAKDGATKDARALDAANGKGYLPTNADHPDDAILNYQPTVNPVPSGGYYWVVFTSRRMYGNLIAGKPFGASGNGGGPIKKLWVAAVEMTPGATIDPSHPAFYLPGQELDSGNTRGFWVVDPCKANGNSCESGDECCNGFCRKDPDGGALVCQDKPPGSLCSQEFEKCTVDADCCDPTQKCINGKCSLQSPIIK